MAELQSLTRDISPPPTRKSAPTPRHSPITSTPGDGTPTPRPHDVELVDGEPTLAAVEAGLKTIHAHLTFFSKNLSSVVRPSSGPRLSMSNFTNLYERNQDPSGRHWVVHQHDHPVSGRFNMYRTSAARRLTPGKACIMI